MASTKLRVQGNRVYEINRKTGEILHIHDKDKFFQDLHGEEIDI